MTNGEDMFHVGHDRLWPNWFHDQVTNNQIITRSGGWKRPIISADVMINGQYHTAHRGDWIVLLSGGRLGIIKAEVFK